MELNKETRLGKRNRGVGDLLQKINLAVKSSRYFRSSLSSMINNSNFAISNGDHDKSASDQPIKKICISSSKRSGCVNCAQGVGSTKNLYNSSTKFTVTPQLDGYVWRKYGEKKIANCKYSRCYYRCTYYQELNCNATKQVQQCTDDESPMYKVTYFQEHTCKNIFFCNTNANDNYQKILDFASVKDPSNSLSKQSASSSDGLPVNISSSNMQQVSDQSSSIGFQSVESNLHWFETYAMDEMLSDHHHASLNV